MIFVALDGDDVGNKLERAILDGDVEEIRRVSKHVSSRVEQVRGYLQQHGGEVVLAGGDNLLAVFRDRVDVAGLARICVCDTGVSFSVGLGESLREAWVALKYAKTCKPSMVSAEGGSLRVVAAPTVSAQD